MNLHEVFSVIFLIGKNVIFRLLLDDFRHEEGRIS